MDLFYRMEWPCHSVIFILKKSLVEAGYLDNARSQELNHILLDPELKDVIEHTKNPNALIAFGCM